METLPSIWGKHAFVIIEPVMVRGRIITVISGAPDDWVEKLLLLRFERTQNGWCRLGAMKQAEFEVLSAEIDLIGMRPDLVSEVVHPSSDLPPMEMVDVLLRLWQRQPDSCKYALQLEHPSVYSAAQCWSCIEAAILGYDTPESNTLFGLALAKLQKAGAVKQNVEQFCARRGISDTSLETKDKSKPLTIIIERGATVEFIGETGSIDVGRLAEPLYQGASGAWVYANSPAWVGGYPLVSPVWAQNPIKIGDSLSQSKKPLSPPGVELERDQEFGYDEITGSIEHFKALEFIANSSTGNVLSNWRIRLKAGQFLLDEVTDNTGTKTNDLTLWFENLEASIRQISYRVYGDEPYEFVLTGTQEKTVEGSIAMRYSVISTVKESLCGVSANKDVAALSILTEDTTENPMNQYSRKLNLRRACDRAEESRSNREKKIRRSASSIGLTVGINSPVIISHELGGSRPTFWPRFAEQYGGKLGSDNIFKALSLVMRGDSDFTKRLSLRAVDNKFRGDFFTPTGARYTISLNRFKETIVSAAAIDEYAQGNIVNEVDWVGRIQGEKFEGFVVTAEWSLGMAPLISNGVSTVIRGKVEPSLDQPRLLIKSWEEAIDTYQRVLLEVKELSPSSTTTIDSILGVLPRYAIFEEALHVPNIIRGLSAAELFNRINLALLSSSNEFVNRPAGEQVKIVNKVAGYLSVDGSQGVSIALSPTKFRIGQIASSPDLAVHTREKELNTHLSLFKDALKLNAEYIYLDAIQLADHELVNRINQSNQKALKSPNSPFINYSNANSGTPVEPLAEYSFRSLAMHSLLEKASLMDDTKRTSILRKELIWPKKSLYELKQHGCDLGTSIAVDLIWKSLPASPKSPDWKHTQAFITLLYNFKLGVETHLHLPFQEPTGRSFQDHLRMLAHDIFNDNPILSTTYSRRELKTHHFQMNLFDCDFSADLKFEKMLEHASWRSILSHMHFDQPKKLVTSAVNNDQAEAPTCQVRRFLSGQDFIDTFGFIGVEYGSWVSDAERIKHLSFAFDSMIEFSEIVGCEPLALSLGGRLGLCFGSRARVPEPRGSTHTDSISVAMDLFPGRAYVKFAHEYFKAIFNHYVKSFSQNENSPNQGLVKLMLDVEATFEPTYCITGSESAQDFYNLIFSIFRKAQCSSGEFTENEVTERSDILTNHINDNPLNIDSHTQASTIFSKVLSEWFSNRMDPAQRALSRKVNNSGESGAPDETGNGRSTVKQKIDRWLDSLWLEVGLIDHPFLGKRSFPVVDTQSRIAMPLSPHDLSVLVDCELKLMFKDTAPNVLLIDDPSYKAGMYSLASDLITLNVQYAERGDFINAAWHAASQKLLTSVERQSLQRLFDPAGSFAEQVRLIMLRSGDSLSVTQMLSDPNNVQGYAFQYWEKGSFSFDHLNDDHSPFKRVNRFVGGVFNVTDMVGGEKEARILFENLYLDELATLRTLSQPSARVAVVRHEADWGDDNVLVWDTHEASNAMSIPKFSQ